MTTEITFVFALLGVTAALMASNRVRFDIVALLVVLALMLSGVLSVGEALAGFGSSVVMLVAALLVVGEMLDRTGVARAVGDLILRRGGTSETRLLIFIMIAAALLGGFMSSTAVVAIFIPIALRIAAETNVSAKRLLLPMSYAALISGMLTLIATTPNIVVNEELHDAGIPGFGFFGFTLIGLAVLAAAVAYMILAGRWLLPASDEPEARDRNRLLHELLGDFGIDDRFEAIRLPAGSSLAGTTVAESGAGHTFGVRLLGISRPRRRGRNRILTPTGETELRAEDVLLVVAEPDAAGRLVEEFGLEPRPLTDRERQQWLWELGGAAVLVHPDSQLIGRSLRDVEFRSTYGLHALGLRRATVPMSDFQDTKLKSGDSLCLFGAWSRIDRLHTHAHDFVVTALPRERKDVVAAQRKMPFALIILAAMVLLVVFDIVPLVAAVILAALAAVVTRCLTMEDAYRSIHWSSVVLVAGMLPLADALEKTGGTDLVVETIMAALGDVGPRTMLTVIFVLTAVIGLFLSNTASAILVAPIAIDAAKTLEVSPYPFAVAVIIAASAAFSTPVSTPVVTLVVEPGRYRFMDFVKIGVPLLLLTWLVTMLLVPLVFPFDSFEWALDPALPDPANAE